MCSCAFSCCDLWPFPFVQKKCHSCERSKRYSLPPFIHIKLQRKQQTDGFGLGLGMGLYDRFTPSNHLLSLLFSSWFGFGCALESGCKCTCNGNLSYHVSERVVDKKLHSLRLSLFTHDSYDIPIALPVVGLPHFHNTIPPIPLVQAQEI